MGLGRRIVGVFVIAVAAIVVGCGGGGGSNSDTDRAGTEVSQAGQTEVSQADQVEARKPSEPEASKTFLKKGSKNKIATFGEEASAKEREAASSVLEENMQARESGEWAKQCSSLSPGAIEDVKEIASTQGGKGGGCTKELEFRAQPLKLTKGLRANTMTGPIDALRFKGARAYALYHGADGRDYAMPMEKVDGEWKVDDLLTEEL